MKKTSTFRALRQELLVDPTFRADVAREKMLMKQLDLTPAREVSGLTQEAVARHMGNTQENVSRIERQSDVLVSTLQAWAFARGAELEITAVFPNKRRIALLKPAPR